MNAVAIELSVVACVAFIGYTHLESRGVTATELLIVAMVATLVSCAAS